MGDDQLYLGTSLDEGARATLDSDHLTTHAVCLGMTGSGKTGLGIVVLEELARRGTPLLVIDLKGDLVDLLLNFPDLNGDSFAPWVPTEDLRDRSRSEAGAEVANRWREGLAASGLDGSDIGAVRSGVQWQLVTPGLAGAAPLDILPSLAAPAGWRPDTDPDATRDRIDGVVSALLSLVGRGGDPLTDRDHVVMASILLDSWRRGASLDLAGLVRAVASPPFEALGALPLETVYPRDERMQLVMALNTLVASPAFAAWTRGLPLDMESILGTATDPRATILSVAHLDERQRMFVLALVISELVAWMRRQPASAGLRTLLYLDEVQGILPPHPANPPTKRPLLTLLKQGRAFGVGAWLATQNPVDLDYKAAGNAGVQAIGRLITEHDRERALDGLGLKILEDGRKADQVVAGLGKRQFLLVDVRATPRARTFSSRWAMSYLRGPVASAEMAPLLKSASSFAPAATPRPAGARDPEGSTEPPLLATDVDQLFVVDATGLLAPRLVVRSRLAVERRSIGLARDLEEIWQVPFDDRGRTDWGGATRLEGAPSLATEADPGALFPKAAPTDLEASVLDGERDFAAWRARQPVEMLSNATLKLVAEPDESRDAFISRCLAAADLADDSQQERARTRFEKRMATVRNRLERERDELDRDRDQVAARKTEEKLGMVEGLFQVLLGSRSVRSAARKAASKARSTASKRRMRQSAEASIVESENEIDRLTDELERLAEEMQEEIDRIAAESEAVAEKVESVSVRPTRGNIEVQRVELVWG
jgi:hypothetical protein